MNRKVLFLAICASLLVASTAYAKDAAGRSDSQSVVTQSPSISQAQEAEKKPATLETVTVTGSLIPQSKIENANPVITITGEDMVMKGYNSVSEALRAQPLSTGAVLGSTYAAGFAPGAETISLLGLSPDFTLVLINGHPMADYPLLYNGIANFTDLSTIPMSLVDRVDILPGNQSSIYGSAAIAGVVNVILKKRMDGYDLSYRAGGYTQGGGQNQRLSFAGGYNTDKLHLMYALQFNDQQPIFGFDRDLTASTLGSSDPTHRYASPSVLHWQALSTGFNFLDPDVEAPGTGCSALSGLFGGTVSRQYGPFGEPGYFCGSTTVPGYATMLNEKRSASGYLHFDYQLNNNATLYGQLLYTVQKQQFYYGPNYNWWAPDGGNYIYNVNTGTYDYYEKLFAPEETGGLLAASKHALANAYTADVGIRGGFGDSDWTYDAYLARSDYQLYNKQLHPLTDKINAYFEDKFLGPKLGTMFGFGEYAPNDAGFYQPVSAADYLAFSDFIRTDSHTYTQTGSFQLTNPQLFELPAGPVGFAAIVQAGNQYWSNPVDPREAAGDFWGTVSTSGEGKRNNYAGAVEFRVPIATMFSADVSARYDHYSNVQAGSDGRATYKLGLEFRPLDSLLLRANYATAFRAPDMAYVFAGPSSAAAFATDYYKCEKYQATVALPSCTWNSVQYMNTHEGNPELKSITAKSWGYGVVWSPTSKLTLKADYYNIGISNEVSDLNVNTLLLNEASCRSGKLDPSSPTCIDALQRIQRAPVNSNPQFSENITGITTGPINVSNEHVDGIVASADWRVDAGRFGDFTFSAHYNVTLDHSYQQYPGDPVRDTLHEPIPWFNEFKTVANASTTWKIGRWTSTLAVQRYGATPNYAAQQYGWGGGAGPYARAGTVAPWITYNASVAYDWAPGVTTRLVVQNLFDAMPPRDQTWVWYPFYNYLNYNPYGRAVWAEINVHFGG